MKSKANRIAAIDIGSNTIHMVVINVAGRHLDHCVSESVILKLGAVVSKHRALPPDVHRKVRHTLRRFIRQARGYNVGHILIAATQAMRSLRHSELIVQRLSKEVGIPIHVLSGEREAQLGFLGVKCELRPRERSLVIDSGGASTELTLVQGTRLIETVSIPLGAAVLSARLHNDPPTAFEVARLMIPIIKGLHAAPMKTIPDTALLTGGTAHHLVSVAKANPLRLNRADLERALRRLLKKPARRIAKKYEMEQERARLLAPGAMLVTALLDHYGLDHLRMTKRGLRDGMVCAFLKDREGWWK